MIGLGRMSGNMVQRLLDGNHSMVVYDQSAQAVAASQARGAVGASSLANLADRSRPPRAVWVMLPAGQPTEDTISSLIPFLSSEDTVLDGANANYRDTMRRADKLRDTAATSWAWASVAASGA